jgi:hypothetical protein
MVLTSMTRNHIDQSRRRKAKPLPPTEVYLAMDTT